MKVSFLAVPALSIILVASAWAKTPMPVQMQEDPLGITLSAGYDSAYVFRGVHFADHLVTASIEGAFPLSDLLSLNVAAWYGASADDSFAPGGSYHELDLSTTLTANLGLFTLGLKYQYYLYEGDAGDVLDNVHEVGVLLATSVGPVDLVGGAYYDETADGFYFETGVQKSIEITDRIRLVPAALVSYAVDYYGVDGFNHVKASVSLPIKLTSNATLTPYIAGNLPVDALEGLGEEDRLYGGVTLSVSF